MLKLYARLNADRRGATAIEYGLIVSLIFLAAVGAMQAFGAGATDMWFLIANDYLNA